MEALALAGIKAELRADGLPTHSGGLSVSAAVFLKLAARLAEHGDGWIKTEEEKAEVKVRIKVEPNTGAGGTLSAPAVPPAPAAVPPAAEPGSEPGLGDGPPWQRAQPCPISKQPVGPSGAAHERKRERGHTEMERARKRKQTGQRASSATGRPPNDGGWVGWLAKLKAYKSTHGDCNVPLHWAEDPGLGQWVADQRQGKKALDRGEPSRGMTAARAAKLEALGFAWAPPRGGAAQR